MRPCTHGRCSLSQPHVFSHQRSSRRHHFTLPVTTAYASELRDYSTMASNHDNAPPVGEASARMKPALKGLAQDKQKMAQIHGMLSTLRSALRTADLVPYSTFRRLFCPVWGILGSAKAAQPIRQHRGERRRCEDRNQRQCSPTYVPQLCCRWHCRYTKTTLEPGRAWSPPNDRLPHQR